MEIELKIALSILIPVLVGLYIYGLWRFKQQGKDRLVGWTLEDVQAHESVPKEDRE